MSETKRRGRDVTQQMQVIVVEMSAPLAARRARFYALGDPEASVVVAGDDLAERVAAAARRGHDRFVVDLGGVASADKQDVLALTDLVWTIRAEGGRPAVASPHRDVTDALRFMKMDRAFTVAPDLTAAVVALAE